MTEAAGLRSIDGMDRAMEAARTKHIKSFRASDAAALWEISTTLAVQLVLFAAHPVLPFCTFVPVAALMFIRWFVLFHDAGHGSLAASPALNRLLHRFCGVCCWTPCDWRGKHRLHHATAGNLDNDFGAKNTEMNGPSYHSCGLKLRKCLCMCAARLQLQRDLSIHSSTAQQVASGRTCWLLDRPSLADTLVSSYVLSPPCAFCDLCPLV
eukprot:SAG31_NODE_2065_length_6530_cov_22.048515_1_plen_210_part_00